MIPRTDITFIAGTRARLHYAHRMKSAEAAAKSGVPAHGLAWGELACRLIQATLSEHLGVMPFEDEDPAKETLICLICKEGHGNPK
jgi:hypothetical protein